MSDESTHCMHSGCTCEVVIGAFCSEYCRAHAADEETTCRCSHLDCAGSDDLSESVA